MIICFPLSAPLTHLSSPSYQMDESYTIQTSKGNNNTKPPNWRSYRNPNPSKDEYTWNDGHYMYHNEFVSYIYKASDGFLPVQEYALCILCILCFTANNIFTAMKKVIEQMNISCKYIRRFNVLVIVNTFGLYTLKIDAWSLISDIHSSIVLQISCIIILIVHTYCSSLLCSKHIFFV